MAAISGTIGLNPMEFADYTRFMPVQNFRRSLLSAVIGPFAIMMFVAFPLGMYFTLATGVRDPGEYFVILLGPWLGLTFAWISQTRINMTNVYAGSVAVSSISQRLFNRQLGRLPSIGLICGLAIVLMFANVLEHLLLFLAWDGIFLLSWVGCVVADIVLVKRVLRIVPTGLRHKRKDLPDFNLVGLGAVGIGVVTGSLLFFQDEWAIVSALAPYIALVVSGGAHVALAVITGGRTYRPSETSSTVLADAHT